MINNIQQAASYISHLRALSRDEPTNPDIGTVLEIDKNGGRRICSAVCTANRKGYRPFTSIPVGVSRIWINLVDAIKNICNTVLLRQSLGTGLKNICHNTVQMVRGTVEIVPVAGNLTVYLIDRIRIKRIEAQINQETLADVGIRNYYLNGVRVSNGTDTSAYDEDISFMSQGGARFV